jgi:DNA-binding response OmpR family regulator
VTDRVLLIEDDADIALGVGTMLSRNGFAVTTAGDGREGLRAFHGERPDIVILDVGLPEMDGWTVLERIRELSEVPVLMLTAHGQESDKVRGLRTGADDYVTKPFGNAEFVARVRALLRRAGSSEQDPTDVYDDGRVRVNFAAHEVLADGVPVELTATEYRLLVTLVRHRGQVLSAVRLLDLVWNDPVGIGPERVKYSVMRLRRKLGATSGADSPIEAVRGFGYRYRTDRNRAAPLRQPSAYAAEADCPGHEILRFSRDIG